MQSRMIEGRIDWQTVFNGKFKSCGPFNTLPWHSSRETMDNYANSRSERLRAELEPTSNTRRRHVVIPDETTANEIFIKHILSWFSAWMLALNWEPTKQINVLPNKNQITANYNTNMTTSDRICRTGSMTHENTYVVTTLHYGSTLQCSRSLLQSKWRYNSL